MRFDTFYLETFPLLSILLEVLNVLNNVCLWGNLSNLLHLHPFQFLQIYLSSILF